MGSASIDGLQRNGAIVSCSDGRCGGLIGGRRGADAAAAGAARIALIIAAVGDEIAVEAVDRRVGEEEPELVIGCASIE